MAIKLKSVLAEHGIPLADLARSIDISRPTLSLICNHGQWPKSPAKDVLVVRIMDELTARLGNDDWDADGLFEKVADERGNARQPVESTGDEAPNPLQEKTKMLSHAEWLSHAAKRHFGLTRDPFQDDVESPEDVYLGGEHRYALEAMHDALLGHRFVAVVGESGSGKTTIRRLFLEKNRDQKRAAIVMPYVLDAEDSEKRGKPIRGRDIQEAIVRKLAPGQSIPSSRQALTGRVEELLKASAASGRRNLLLIEEAHTLPIPTLRQLKRLQELEDGMTRIIGVLLIGQPELLDKLDIRQNWEAREVIQRCEIAPLRTLDTDVEGYLRLKFERVRKPLEAVLEKDALDAIKSGLTVRSADRRTGERVTSYVYPLAINNLLTRAMNICAEYAFPKVGGEQIRKAMEV